ncbi:MAG: bifunctional pyr operon transcriptional regulator/uracil phosphoribosyltransferase PyrR [Desulfobulbaceae bacterium]|jgi:pyrimidine operon attenuation protein/uracil phosphoribosyltransferase|nr:bifunctional pyr operon transcriptional regulator/uracil phosphoribosyltransferase PyrR [Desulfobulbaceae bacterium]
MNQRILMRQDEIDLALRRIALQILEKNHQAPRLAVVGIHTCGVFLARRLRDIISRDLRHPVDYGDLDINLYRDDWSLVSQNPVVRTTDIPFEVNDSALVLVDDVIFTGRTIRAAMDAIMDFGRPRAVQLAVLVDRGGRELPIQPDYTGLCATVLPHERIAVRLAAGDENLVVIEGE